MRSIATAGILVVLVAAAIVLYLNGRAATSDLAAVERAATGLRTGAVEPRSLDWQDARRAISYMEELIADPSAIEGSLSRLEEIARDAASWAEGSMSGSAELHAAVSIRAAADELRAYATDGRDEHLARARIRLERSGATLSGSGGAPSGTMTGLKDRLDNVEQSQRERMLELNDALK